MNHRNLRFICAGALLLTIAGFGAVVECATTAVVIISIDTFHITTFQNRIPAWADMPVALTGEAIGLISFAVYLVLRHKLEQARGMTQAD